jgi:AcrR family transcriptional regulator
MRDLATAMGIKAASLYNHISSKQEILSDIIISLAEEFTYGLEAIKKTEENSIEKLKKICHLHVNITANNPYGMASLNNDWMHLEDQLTYYKKLRKDYEEDFRTVIEEGVKTNLIKDAKTDVMLFSMLSTLRSLYIWLPKKEDVKLELFADELSSILINGINK